MASLSDDDKLHDDNIDKKAAEKIVHGPANIPELLAPMAKEPCLTKTKDWWTYEVCFKIVAMQYHLEGKTNLSLSDKNCLQNSGDVVRVPSMVIYQEAD